MRTITKESIPQYLERRMRKAGMTQRDYAKKIGISQSYLSDIMRGKRGLSADVQRKVGLEMVLLFRVL